MYRCSIGLCMSGERSKIMLMGGWVGVVKGVKLEKVRSWLEKVTFLLEKVRLELENVAFGVGGVVYVAFC